MAARKRTDKATEIRIMTAHAASPNNTLQAARLAGVPNSTARKIIAEHKDDPEYVKLCQEKREEFIRDASEVIRLGTERILEALNDGHALPLRELTMTVGTFYDKRALAEGSATQRVNISADDSYVDKIAELAGYVKRDE